MSGDLLLVHHVVAPPVDSGHVVQDHVVAGQVVAGNVFADHVVVVQGVVGPAIADHVVKEDESPGILWKVEIC